uniref:Tudor domain-containing protein n=1 Tax=Glossina brevipalpis TaxID=37001 RepID=A0A1A9X0A8_9MUSC
MSINKTNLEQAEKVEDPWDDTLLIKAYDYSIKLAREELARRIALSTSKFSNNADDASKSTSEVEELMYNVSEMKFKVGDYVRATYEDGKDYEAKILSINSKTGTCILKYIGYDNQQEVRINDLVPSWGKKVRRLQFAKSKIDESLNDFPKINSSVEKNLKKGSDKKNAITVPPPPPIPPMLTTDSKSEDSEHLSAMLMSWYMSGYYTECIQISKSKSDKPSHHSAKSGLIEENLKTDNAKENAVSVSCPPPVLTIDNRSGDS